MIFPSHPSPVPLFHSLESGTVEQTLNQRNSPRNNSGTFSLKAIANKVLERNKDGNKPGTAASKSVPPLPQSFSSCGTNGEDGCKVETDDFLYDFEERLAIAEYDGDQTSLQAHRIAYLDAFISVLATLPATDLQRDWLDQRIQTSFAWIEAQGFQSIN